jgi:dTMP kinase
VVLTGIDGSGKTTAAKQVARELHAAGFPARYFENAGGRPPLNYLARRLGHRDAVEWLGLSRFETVEMHLRHFAMRRTLRWLKRGTGRVAVCDRWTYCQYAVMVARSSDPSRARQVYQHLPDPDVVCFLETEPGVAQLRVEARGKDTETIEHLRAYDAAYRGLAEFASFKRVEANGSAESVVGAVLSQVMDHG